MTPQNDFATEPCFVISVAARMVGLHAQTLRYYERVGLVVPSRSQGRQRLYSMADVERLRRIKTFADDMGVNLAGAELALKLTDQIRDLQAQVDALTQEVVRLRASANNRVRRHHRAASNPKKTERGDHMGLSAEKFTRQAQEPAHVPRNLEELPAHPMGWEHVSLALVGLEDGLPERILKELGVDPELVKSRLHQSLEGMPKVTADTQQIFVTPRLQRVLQVSDEEAQRLHDQFISVEHLMVAAARENSGDSARLFQDLGINQEMVYQAMQKLRGAHRVDDPNAEQRYRSLEKYSVDLTELARVGKLDPVVGREQEIRQVMQTLTRRTKNNPVLIGEAAGVRPPSPKAWPADHLRRCPRLPAQPASDGPGMGRLGAGANSARVRGTPEVRYRRGHLV